MGSEPLRRGDGERARCERGRGNLRSRDSTGHRSRTPLGARRLHTIMEYVLEEISFSAKEYEGSTVPISADFVRARLGEIVEEQDLSRYIL